MMSDHLTSKPRFCVAQDDICGLFILDGEGEFSRMTPIVDDRKKLQKLCDMLNRAAEPPNDLPADIQAEWERMARDAERYRFLRQPGNAIVYAKDRNAWGDNVSGHVAYKTAEELDAAIDVARRAETKPATNPDRIPPRDPSDRMKPDEKVRCSLCDAGIMEGEVWTFARECCEAGKQFDIEKGVPDRRAGEKPASDQRGPQCECCACIAAELQRMRAHETSAWPELDNALRSAGETSLAHPTTWAVGDNGLCKHCGLSWFLHIVEDDQGRKDVCTSLRPTVSENARL